MPSASTHDVVVIGAGVQGTAVAWRLAQAGVKVLLLEKSIPGAEASSAAAGILSPGVEAEEPGPFAALCQASLDRYPSFVKELEALAGFSVGLTPGGTLQVAFDDSSALVLAGRAEQLSNHELEVEVLDAVDAARLEPSLSPRVRGGIYFPREQSIDPRLMARALVAAAKQAGVTFLTGGVRRIVHEGGRVTGVEHETGFLSAGAVVLAAGSWSPLVEGNALPRGAVRPVRGQIALLDAKETKLARVIFSDKGYVVPRPDGRLLCGSTMEEVGYEKAVTAGGLQSVLALALEIAPGLSRAPILDTWSNFRPASPDGWPVLGPATVPGLFYATGHTRNGILLTPITAEVVAAAVQGKTPSVPLAPFSVTRLQPRRG
jgi:glycine oxidase